MTLVAGNGKLPPLAPGEFRFITNGIVPEPVPSDGGKRRFRAIASSTITDNAGHNMRMTALEDMRNAFRNGVMIFMDHDYSVPKKVFGMSDQAEIMESGASDPKTGAAIWDLHIGGFVDETNPIAIQLHDSMLGGMRYGTSIGAYVKEAVRKKPGPGLDISHVDLKEGSIVGIPKNQRSWVQKAANAFANLEDAAAVRMFGDDDDEPEMVTQGDPTPDPVNPQSPVVWTVGDLGTNTIVTLGEAGPETVTSGDMCPACGKGHDAEDCDDDYHKKSVEVAEVAPPDDDHSHDSEDGQEAEVATPEEPREAEVATPEPVTESEPVVATYSDEDVLELARNAGSLANLLTQKDEEIAALTAERDRLAAENAEAAQVIEKIVAMPLRPRAQEHLVKMDRKLPDFFDPEVKIYLGRFTGDRE